MTNKEASEYFKNTYNFSYAGLPRDIDDFVDARDLAIKALEKQTPKKVIHRRDIPGMYGFTCPCCGEFNGFFESAESMKRTGCAFCLQSIDWTEEGE